MPVRVFQATHPDMIVGLDAARLRNHYLLTSLFASGEVQLNYSHVERFIVGGATPSTRALTLDARSRACHRPGSSPQG